MIPPDRLPLSLWNDGVIHLPMDVNNVYEEKLRQLDLYEHARIHGGARGEYGGATKDQTHSHFAAMYANSVSRVQCVLLDPHKVFAKIPHYLLTTLSSHRISILDIPCGAGASTISALATLKELRNARIVPTMPLSVSIIGGDISQYALDIYESQFNRLSPHLAAVGIDVSLNTRIWDAKDVQQTNTLLDDYLGGCETHNEFLVLITNFSGASKKLLDDFEESFRLIWIRLSSQAARSSTILWIEPEMTASKSLFKRISDLMKPYNWFIKTPDKKDSFLRCEYHWFARIAEKSVKSTAIVHHYQRGE